MDDHDAVSWSRTEGPAAPAAETPDGEGRVTTLELFFDLVFVFTITQLTASLARDMTWRTLLQVALMFGVIWWMYGGYAWLTNSVRIDRPVRQILLMGGMAGFFVISLAIPDAFGKSGVAFGIGYLVVTVIHNGLFAQSDVPSVLRALLGIAPLNLLTAALVLAGGY